MFSRLVNLKHVVLLDVVKDFRDVQAFDFGTYLKIKDLFLKTCKFQRICFT